MDRSEHPFETPRPANDGYLYRSLVEQVPAVVYIASNELLPRSLYVSPQCVEMFGRKPEDFLADRDFWPRCIHPDDRGRVVEAWGEAIRTQGRFDVEYRWVRADGSVLRVHDTSLLVRDDGGKPLFWHGLLDDITTVQTTEAALREADARYRFLVENIPAVVYMVAPDDDRRTLYVSPQIEQALGYGRGEWLGQPDIWMELLHPDDRETTLARHDEHNETGDPWSEEYRLITSDGRAVWFRDVANLVRDDDGQPLYWLGVQMDVTQLRLAQDHLRTTRDVLEQRVRERTAELEEANELMALEIDERRRAEAELRDAEERYRALAENIPAVTYIWDIDPTPDRSPLSYTSPRIEQMLGYSVHEWRQGHEFCRSRVHPDDRQAVSAASLRSEATGEPFWLEYRYLHKDGHIVWVLDQAVLVSRRDDGSGLTDLTLLSGLTNLTTLNVSGTGLTDLTLLSGLTNLTTLNVSGTGLTDLTPLSGLTNLTTLNVSGTGLTDLTPLSGLTNLTALDVSFNELTDLTPLSGLTNLTALCQRHWAHEYDAALWPYQPDCTRCQLQ